MHEVRLQSSAEHKTRLRLWRSSDATVGGRLEVAHSIGTLEQRTELVSRFSVEALGKASFWSEDNGYLILIELCRILCAMRGMSLQVRDGRAHVGRRGVARLESHLERLLPLADERLPLRRPVT
jgi:hypothetical protein